MTCWERLYRSIELKQWTDRQTGKTVFELMIRIEYLRKGDPWQIGLGPLLTCEKILHEREATTALHVLYGSEGLAAYKGLPLRNVISVLYIHCSAMKALIRLYV